MTLKRWPAALLMLAAIDAVSGFRVTQAGEVSCRAATQTLLSRLRAELRAPSGVEHGWISGAPLGGQLTVGEAKVVEAMQASATTALPAVSREEAVAVMRNFHPEPVLDGTTSLFVVGGKLEVDASMNLVGAYRKATARFAQRPRGQDFRLRSEDIVGLRQDAMDVLSVQQKTGDIQLAQYKGLWRESQHTTNLPKNFNLSPYVEGRMKAMGFKLERGPNGIKIDTSAVDFKKQLDLLVERVNQRIAAGQDPDLITAYATQELLILHPFNAGNGRTGRLLGQILDRELTGNVRIFPADFDRELEMSLTELTGLLKKGKGQMIPADLQAQAAALLETVQPLGPSPPSVLKTRKNYEVLTWKDAPRSPRDHARQEWELLVPNREGVYSKPPGPKTLQVPREATRFDGDVFFGKGFETAEQAQQEAARVFTYGRGIPEGTTVAKNLSAHVEGYEAMQGNGFMQTSKESKEALGFARMSKVQKLPGGKETSYLPRFALVYRIDARGAEVLDLSQMGKVLSPDATLTTQPYGGGLLTRMIEEEEVVFPGLISPDRFRTAELIEYAADGKTVLSRKVLINPGYRSR